MPRESQAVEEPVADIPEITFHGAARTVTGSCMEVTFEDRRILVDCGLFQGSRSLERLNLEEFPFDPDSVDAVILTHAHIDHCGLLPKLVARGFGGPIHCTAATADLLEFMLADAGRIQEFEAERRNRRRDRAGHEPFAPIYTEADALEAWSHARPVPLEQWFEPVPGFRARLWNAGHILGSASVELEVGGVRMLFSGDLGPEHKAFQADPEGPSHLDYVVCESTYGGRTRPRCTIAERRAVLEDEINRALGRGGNLVIPSFALERTQELLLDIAHLVDDNRVAQVPVFVDSPLAIRATNVFARYTEELEDLDGRNIFRHPAFEYTQDAEESMRIDTFNSAIIIAASGMCEAGRIRHHLRNNLCRHDSTVLFVGFQAQGSLGRIILDGAERVRISGSDVDVRAQIRRIDTYSAHADHNELVEWLRDRTPVTGAVFLDHGEPEAVAALAGAAQELDSTLTVVAPDLGARYRLHAGGPAEPLGTAEPRAYTTGRDWQNEYAAFAVDLREKLLRIEDRRAREQAIADMNAVLESYSSGARPKPVAESRIRDDTPRHKRRKRATRRRRMRF